MQYRSPVTNLTLNVLFCVATAFAQTVPTPSMPAATNGYILGPGDQISVFVADLSDEFTDKTFRVDTSGDISLPLIGHLHAAGLTTSDLEQSAKANLTHVLRHPEVSISIVGFGSKFVSVLGAVNTPGVRPIDSPKTLFEMLSAAGGLRPDAGYLVTITRNTKYGSIPLIQAQTDSTGQTSVASIKLKDIMTSSNPAENISIIPGDTISVPKADLVYAVGCVVKPGGFLLNEHESLSTLQVMSLAEGAQKTAALTKARILRAVPGSPSRVEIAVNLKRLMAGRGADIPLQPDDILFIPNSNAKSVGYRTIDSVIAAATGFAVYGTRGGL